MVLVGLVVIEDLPVSGDIVPELDQDKLGTINVVGCPTCFREVRVTQLQKR
jgi:hypothetical protein